MKYAIVLRKIVPVILTLVIFAVLFTRVDWEKICLVMKGINVPYALMALIFSLFAITVFGVGRLQYTLQVFGLRISFKEVLVMKMGSMPLKVLPSGKWNLLSQIIYLKRNLNFSLLSGVHATALRLFLDLFSCLLLIVPSGFYWILIKKMEYSPWLKYAILASAFLGSCYILFLILLRHPLFQKVFISRISRLNLGWEIKLNSFFEFYRRLTYQKLFLLLVYSMVFQYSALLVFYLLTKSLGLNIPWSSIILFLPIVIILTAIPISFLGLGVRESLILFFLSSYGPKEAILSLGVLFSLCDQIFPSFLGLVFTKAFLAKLYTGYQGD